MLYLATFEYVEPGPLYSPDKVVNMVDKAIGDSLTLVQKLEGLGVIKAAGVFAGMKGSAMILDVPGHVELSQTLQSLPFWSIMKVCVTPLQPFAERHGQEMAAVAGLKGLQGAAPGGTLDWW